MNDHEFITGLMRENYESLGFIPDTTVRDRYLTAGRYIIQNNAAGQPVGYLLHGSPQPGGVLTVAQAVIECDKRERDYGRQIFYDLLTRARQANCRSITLRCAEDLESNGFWLAMGFEKTNTTHPNNQRKRAVNVYTLDLVPTLFDLLKERE